jgi:hypothetical protein
MEQKRLKKGEHFNRKYPEKFHSHVVAYILGRPKEDGRLRHVWFIMAENAAYRKIFI